VIDCCVTPNCVSYILARRSYIRWHDDDDIRSLIDQHAELDIYSAISLKQQSASTHVALLG